MLFFSQTTETLSKFTAKVKIFSMDKKDKKQDEGYTLCLIFPENMQSNFLAVML